MPIERIERTPLDEERLAALRDLFPEVFSDGKVNVERLRKLLAGEAAELGPDEEHYGLRWPGQKKARQLANRPVTGTLRTAPGEGVNEDTTQNLLVVGDNLEVLRILRRSYEGRVKLIYIDPPYNTGKDFIYKDDFAEPVSAYLEATRQADVEGLLTSNPKDGGRFHSKWLSMMYPRLALARDLLRDDGIIAISIDDNEVSSLRLVLDEVFGATNFIAQVIWNAEGHSDNQYDIKVNHEYLVLYAKDQTSTELGYIVDPNTRAESNLWKGFAENSITKNGPGNPPSTVTLPVGFPCVVETLDLGVSRVPAEFFAAVEQRRYIDRPITKQFDVEYPVRLDSMCVRDAALCAPCRVFSGWANRNKLERFIAQGCEPLAEPTGEVTTFYLSKNGVIYYRKERPAARNIVSVWRGLGTTERMRSELEKMGIEFQYPKPWELLQYVIRVAGVSYEDIVMDFFAGSGTTGDAIMRLNADDGGNRRFILVQLPEKAKTGKLATIDQITKARLRAACAALTQAQTEKLDLDARGPQDFGFRVLHEARSHVRRWVPTAVEDPGGLGPLFQSHNGLVAGWKPADLLVEVMLLEGWPLDSTQTHSPDFIDNTVTIIEHPSLPAKLLVCLENEIYDSTVEKLADYSKNVFVCLEAALVDAVKVRIADVKDLRVKTL